MGTARRRRANAEAPYMAAGTRFGKYKKEPAENLRDAMVNDEVLKALTKAFTALSMGRINGDEDCVERYYRMISNLSVLQGVEYDASDVERFTLMLPDICAGMLEKTVSFEEHLELSYRVGMFLSSIVNNGKDEEYALDLEGLQDILGDVQFMPSNLGFMNRKTIHVKGPAGNYCGVEMEGGKIIIDGEAGEGLGIRMKDGIIILNGDAGEYVGRDMSGGEIRVNGDFESVGNLEFELGHGKVFHKGELLE